MNKFVVYYSIHEILNSVNKTNEWRKNYPHVTAIVNKSNRQVVNIIDRSIIDIIFSGMYNRDDYDFMDIENSEIHPNVGIGFFYLNNTFEFPYSDAGFKHVLFNKFEIRFTARELENSSYKLTDVNEYSYKTKFENDLISVLKSMDETLSLINITK